MYFGHIHSPHSFQSHYFTHLILGLFFSFMKNEVLFVLCCLHVLPSPGVWLTYGDHTVKEIWLSLSSSSRLPVAPPLGMRFLCWDLVWLEFAHTFAHTLWVLHEFTRTAALLCHEISFPAALYCRWLLQSFPSSAMIPEPCEEEEVWHRCPFKTENSMVSYSLTLDQLRDSASDAISLFY